MKGSGLVFDHVDELLYKSHKISLRRGELWIDSPLYGSKEKNLNNLKNDDSCFQYGFCKMMSTWFWQRRQRSVQWKRKENSKIIKKPCRIKKIEIIRKVQEPGTQCIYWKGKKDYTQCKWWKERIQMPNGLISNLYGKGPGTVFKVELMRHPRIK